ncbi:MAG TPA: cytidylate kinase-like family protein [Ktedonobacteraceae bacterium]
MEVNQQAIAAMQAVTISREYGSGGGEIAARLARKLGWQLIDHAIIVQASRELGVYETDVARHDEEYVEGTLSRILNRIRNLSAGGAFIPAASGALPTSGAPLASPPPSAANERAYQEAMQQVVRAAAETGHVVIVGRGGQFLLADRRDVLHLRIVAPLELRVAYVVSREELNRDAAHVRVQEKDRARDRNMQTQFHRKPDDPHLYDLVINTAVLDLDRIVDLICLALEDKASRLSTPPEELGAAAGMTPYPGRPADFSVPQRTSSQS